MNHRLAAHLAHQLRERLGVADIQFVEYLAGHVVPITLEEIVDHRDLVPLLQEEAHGMRADIAGPASN